MRVADLVTPRLGASAEAARVAVLLALNRPQLKRAFWHYSVCPHSVEASREDNFPFAMTFQQFARFCEDASSPTTLERFVSGGIAGAIARSLSVWSRYSFVFFGMSSGMSCSGGGPPP